MAFFNRHTKKEKENSLSKPVEVSVVANENDIELDKARKDIIGNKYLIQGPIPKKEDLVECTIQDLEFLITTGKHFHEQKAFIDDDFIEKIPVFYETLIDKIKKASVLYLAIDNNTGMPHIDGNGNVWMFSTSRNAVNAKIHYELNEQLMLTVKEIPNDKITETFVDFFYWGMESIIMDGGSFMTTIKREEVLSAPDWSNIPKISVPVTNPKLIRDQLMYYEMIYKKNKSEQEQKNEKALSDRFILDMVKANYLCPVKYTYPKGGAPTPDENGNTVLKKGATLSFPIMTDKNDVNWTPAFTDWTTFRKVYDDKEWSGQIMSYKDIATLMTTNNSSGVVINPMSIEIKIDENRKIVLSNVMEVQDRIEREKNSGLLEEKQNNLFVGQPSEYPTELVEKLKHYMKTQVNIRRAYLQLKIENDNDISYLVIIDFDGDKNVVYKGIADATMPYLKNNYMDFHIAYDWGMKMVGDTEPFYLKEK